MITEPSKTLSPHSALGLVLRIALIVGLTEMAIMLVLPITGLDSDATYTAWLDVALLLSVACPLVYLLVVRPLVMEHTRQLDGIRELAHHDALTGLYNRRIFSELLRRGMAAGARHQHQVALFFLDLNGFKPINDQHGHEAGDSVLREIGHRLQNGARAEEVVARFGGDEFVLLVEFDTSDQAEARLGATTLAERLSDLIRQPIDTGSVQVQVDCSIGVHLLHAGEDMETALHMADQAMYAAKKDGKTHLVFSDELKPPSYTVFAIGVREIDVEHEGINTLLNELAAGEPDPEGWERLMQLLDAHFVSEEAISVRLKLNMTEEHKAAHRDAMTALRARAGHAMDYWQSELEATGRLLEQHVATHDRVLIDTSRQQDTADTAGQSAQL
jgi:diguanylate cyclase (GGDEF)-like protein